MAKIRLTPESRRRSDAEATPRRTLWLNPRLDDYREGDMRAELLVPCGLAELEGLRDVEPNLVASRIALNEHNPTSNWHSPVVDIDFPVRVVPSSTPGHHHLYLDGIMMKWEKYESLLKALADAGIIEGGYCKNSLRRQMTMVRLPHVKKPPSQQAWLEERDWPDGVEPVRLEVP